MKQILFRLTDDEYAIAMQKVRSMGCENINQLAKRLVMDLDVAPSNIEVIQEPAKAVKTCLYPHELELIKQNAKLHGMSISREIAIRLRQSCLKNEVCLYPEEILDIRKLKTEVNSIGRNIHYIISGDRYCTVNDPEFRKEVGELTTLCHKIKKTFESLINRIPNRFG